MLQSLHEHIKGWIAGVIIGVISLSFVLWGIQYYLQAGKSNGTAAKVNSKKITENELNLSYQRAQRQFTEHNGMPPTSAQSKQLKQLALQSLILNNVLLLCAKDAGLRVSRNQVNQFIMSIPSFQHNGRFSPQRYQQLLYSNSLTPGQFAKQVSDLLLVNQVKMGIQDSTFVLPQEAKVNYNLLYQKRNFGYFIVPSSKFVNTVKVTPQAIAKYYKQHKETFKTPEKLSIAYITLSPQKISKTIKVSNVEVEQYYQNNLDNYRIPQHWKIQRIFLSIPNGATPKEISIVQRKAQQLAARLKKGSSFDTLMKEQSSITQTVSQAEISPKMSQVLSLMKPGQVSQLFRTSKGMNIVRLVSIVPAKTKLLNNKIRTQIRKILVQQKTNAILNKQNDQLADISYTNPTTLAPAAAALKVNVQTSELFTRQGTKSGIASHPNIVRTAFSDDVLQQGNNSNPIELKDGSIVVLRIKQHFLRRVRSLKEVSMQIKHYMIQQLAQAKAAIVASQVQAILNQGKSTLGVANQYRLIWNTKVAVTRNDKKIAPAILSAAFSLSLQKGHFAKTVVLRNGDFVVVKVLAIKNANFDRAVQKQQQQLVSDITKHMGQLDYQIYVKSAHKHAKIKVFK